MLAHWCMRVRQHNGQWVCSHTDWSRRRHHRWLPTGPLGDWRRTLRLARFHLHTTSGWKKEKKEGRRTGLEVLPAATTLDRASSVSVSWSPPALTFAHTFTVSHTHTHKFFLERERESQLWVIKPLSLSTQSRQLNFLKIFKFKKKAPIFFFFFEKIEQNFVFFSPVVVQHLKDTCAAVCF